jgi:hypothetical protein
MVTETSAKLSGGKHRLQSSWLQVHWDWIQFSEPMTVERNESSSINQLLGENLSQVRLMLDYNSHADVRIENKFTLGTIKTLILQCQYSDNSVQEKTWTDIPENGTTDTWRVGFTSGPFTTGVSWWHIRIWLSDGNEWNNDGWQKGTLTSRDDGKSMTFTVSVGRFHINIPSSSRTVTLWNNGYNSACMMKVSNDLPCGVSVRVTHNYDKEGFTQSKIWNIGPKSCSESPLIVYYNTGTGRFGTDRWNIEVFFEGLIMDILSESTIVTTNETTDFSAALSIDTVGTTQWIELLGEGVRFPFAPAIDWWKTIHGYNTLAFVKFKNITGSTINYLQLIHQYSDDVKYHYYAGPIANDAEMGSHFMIEYQCDSPWSDHWDVLMVLDDGYSYSNTTYRKQCMMHRDDAKSLTFRISKDTLYLDLSSGACEDGMVKGSHEVRDLGIDMNRSYSDNAYLCSHNSFASFSYGFVYSQQSLPILSQLASGVRGLLLDIWYDEKKNDIYLYHENIELQIGWSKHVSLIDALNEIKAFLNVVPDAVITIVFQDEVKDSKYRPLIKKAFETTGMWSRVYPITPDNESKGWPTLQYLVDQKQNLIVFTSYNDPDQINAPFKYQWAYMSENVFDNDCISPDKWNNPRGKSEPLNQKRLCAINQFRKESWPGLPGVPAYIASLCSFNSYLTTKDHIDTCFAKWHRYPNYLNMNFITPEHSDTMRATMYLNSMLHKQQLEIKNEQPSLLKLLPVYAEKGFGYCQAWLDDNLHQFTIPKKAVILSKDLEHLGNLALLLIMLPTHDKAVNKWIQEKMNVLVEYLTSLIPKVKQEKFDDKSAPHQLLWLFPFLLVDSYTKGKLAMKDIIPIESFRKWYQSMKKPCNFVTLISLELMGVELEKDTWNKIISDLIIHDSNTIPWDYQMTHAVIFGTRFGQNKLDSKITTKLLSVMQKRLNLNLCHSRFDISFELWAAILLLTGNTKEVCMGMLRRIENALETRKGFQYFMRKYLGENGSKNRSSKHTESTTLDSLEQQDRNLFLQHMHGVLVMMMALGLLMRSDK